MQQQPPQTPQPPWGSPDGPSSAPPPPPTKPAGPPLGKALAIIGVIVVAFAGVAFLLKSNDDDSETNPVSGVTVDTSGDTDDTLDFDTDDTTEDTTEDTIDIPAGDIPAGAETYTDEDGEYSMSISPAWEDSGGENGDVGWYVNPATGGDNVNIITESYDDSLQDYLDFSADSATSFVEEFELLQSDVVTGSFGQEIGIWVYNATFDGLELTAYATIVVEDGTAVTATYVSPRTTFDANSGAVTPYMMTLQRT